VLFRSHFQRHLWPVRVEPSTITSTTYHTILKDLFLLFTVVTSRDTMKAFQLIVLLSLLGNASAAEQQFRRTLGKSKGKNKKGGGKGHSKSSKPPPVEVKPPVKDDEYKAAPEPPKVKPPIKDDKDKPTPKPPATKAPLDPYDLGLRYNKIKFKDDIVPEGAMLPMMPEDYPLDLATAQWFRKSLCPSIIVEADCNECDISFKYLIDSVGGLPSNPSSDITSPFWENFREVVDMQEKRLNNASVSEFIPLPVIWQGFNISDVADAVHNEILGIYHLDLIKLFFASGSKVDTTIIPYTCTAEFLRGIVLVCYLNSWAVTAVGPLNFGVKYYVGRMRPEEVAWKIHTGEIEAPEDVVETIANFQLTNMTSFTAYPEGCPQHPSWPAMHSAASSASLWLPVVMNLTEAQVCEVKRLDYAISYARTVAGVHYPDDNIDGLNMGQEIIALKLADELHSKYGSDIDVVNEKIKLFRFDWNDFKMSDCYLDGITA